MTMDYRDAAMTLDACFTVQQGRLATEVSK